MNIYLVEPNACKDELIKEVSLIVLIFEKLIIALWAGICWFWKNLPKFGFIFLIIKFYELNLDYYISYYIIIMINIKLI